MAENTVLNVGAAGDAARTHDRVTAKTPVSLIDVGGLTGAGGELIIGDAGVAMPVGGLAAENAAAAGNPVLVGGRYDATPRTLGDGDVGAPALDAAGQVIVVGTGTLVTQIDGDALTALQLLDDAVYTDATGTPSKGLAVMGSDGTNPQLLSVTTGGHVHIHDGGNSITVDGTVELGATDNAVLDAIAASVAAGATEATLNGVGVVLSAIDAKLGGTLTVGSHAVTNAGTFAVQAAQAGSWTVDLGATDNAVLDAILAALQGTLTVSGGGGGTEYTEGDTDATITGTAILWEDAGNTLTPVNASKPLPVGGTVTANAGSGDFTVIQMVAGNLNCTEASAATIATNTGNAATALAIMDDWDNAASDGASVSGDVAHDAADAGEPVKLGAKATAALSGITLVAANDRTNLYAGIDGVQITRPHCNLEDIVSGVAAITDGSSTSVIAAAGAGVKVYVTSVVIANTSATEVTVDIRDGAAGTVKATFPVPANNGGVVFALPVPLPCSANTAVCADPSAAASTVTVTLVGFKSKV